MLPRTLARLARLSLVAGFFLISPLAFSQPDSRSRDNQPAQRPSPEAAKPDESKKPEPTPGEDENRQRDPMSSTTFNGLKFRSLGPAFTSGRVVGFAVDPNNAARY